MVVGGKPVRTGTRNVAPNIATTCWAPKPIVRGHESRSSGRTMASVATVRPSPCRVQGIVKVSSWATVRVCGVPAGL